MSEIIIRKADRVLELVTDEGAVRFPVALGFCPVGHKRREGDGRTPEGSYCVCSRNPQSGHHLALGVSYPGAQDAERALREEQITDVQYGQILQAQKNQVRPPWDTDLGGFIMIHGGGTDSDWTQGCIAVKDEVMDVLWEHCPLGTKITILP